MNVVSGVKIAVIGAGYVGLTTAACLASLGHRVVCADIDPAKVDALSRGEVTIREPGMAELVRTGLADGRLQFVVGAGGAASDAEVVFLCVPTPMGPDGSAKLAALETAVAELRDPLPPDSVVVNKSTVPVGTAARVGELLGRPDVAVASNPEFLREGSAVHDFLNPDRIVIGSTDLDAAKRVAALYEALNAPILLTDPASSEMIKYAANCYLATRLSFVNSIAELCERMGADVDDVTRGMGYDQRIGTAFLRPGPGWGGSCFPKDAHALLRSAAVIGSDFPLLRAAIDTNARQQRLVVDKIRRAVGGQLAGARVGLLGLTFKAGTDDLRDSPALAIAELLAAEGAELVGYDPSMPGAVAGIAVVDSAYRAAAGAAVLVLLTEWPEFRELDWERIAGQVSGRHVIDARNHLDPLVVHHAGLLHQRLGQPEPQRALSR
ncbi:UDP-glucose/GDP-mannose dehydrogenase family protein [Saccharopolyspora indica]|uniref:UDP-glucose dehydrogenase family protein n=1 Tax=Saccharopolyspora indica TaxID=1229659 RepID=UPI0022EA47B7|nr:UDP-glucose/GDP-mannose dehydrogenase family protein [Saccharopolyspora indica]MDA3645200.1 UDP-glucose/GDP-mannose dehydrogenase family protein [Saccharopolyspora indica]